MLLDFEKKVADFIRSNDLFGCGENVLLAVSGGADSTALLHTIRKLIDENILSIRLFCAHINHQLRERQADADEFFVVMQADKLQIPIITKRVDVRGFARGNKLSIETAARKLRIESLLDIAHTDNCSCIATGHHKNDNAETVLQRLARGTGFRGLGGIWPSRVFGNGIKFVRPLLCVTREEILQYLQRRGLNWRIDHTNADCTYRRNYIRHRLLPALQQCSKSSVEEQLFNLSLSAQRLYSTISSRVEKAWQEIADSEGRKVELNLQTFLKEPELVKVELIRQSLTSLGSGERNLSQRHYEKILQLTRQDSPNWKIELPGRFIVKIERERLIFTGCEKATVRSEDVDSSITLEIPGKIQFGRYSIEATILEDESYVERKDKYLAPQFIEGFDLHKLKLPIVVRFRQKGDTFWPLGLAGRKKVGKFLTATHLPQKVRRNALIVADEEKIIWVWPIRICEEAKITDQTQKILQLQITNTD